MTAWEFSTDLAVVGTGVAGLTAALRAAELGLRVVVVTKAGIEDGNTRWAQGGVAVVLPATERAATDPATTDRAATDRAATDRADSVEAHVADTLAAGAGLCDEIATRQILAAGPAAVAALRARGAVFDTVTGTATDAATGTAGAGLAGPPARTREGGHRAFRVIHAGGDATGAEIERALVAAAGRERLPVLDRHTVADVLRDEAGRVSGLALLSATGPAPASGGSESASGGPDGVSVLRARAVLLATGGIGQLYAVSTNPDVATGDGLALALRAGAVAADLEFVQFHPTVLYTGEAGDGRRPLVSEAVRGEGAVLVDTGGRAVMAGEHPLGDLAPRDVVAAAITRRMVATGAEYVLLDATHLGTAAFRQRFPTVYGACRAIGVDPGREPIPVAPAAHYHCGGVVTDGSARTSVPGLYAAGEVAYTGLHGANRLASNSLLEGLVMGTRAAEAVAADLAMFRSPATSSWLALSPSAVSPSALCPSALCPSALCPSALCPSAVSPSAVSPSASSGWALLPGCQPYPVLAAADRRTLQRAMSARAGIGRDADGLTAAATLVRNAPLRRLHTRADVEDANLTLVAAAVLAAATARTETRGCHVRTDFPWTREQWRRSIPVRLGDSGILVWGEPGLLRELELIGGAA